MFCPDCGAALDNVVVGDPCPGCDGLRRSANAPAGVANATASAHGPTIVGESNHPDGSKSIQTGAEGYSSSATSGSQDRQEFSGRPPRNEEDVLEICGALRSAMGSDQVGAFSVPTGRETGVDAVATRTDGTTIQVQVTRVERAAWSTLAREGNAVADEAPDALADHVRTAIESKANLAEREQIVLALDARRAPGYLFAPVVGSFVARHTSWAESVGFQSIWLVGPLGTLTRRIA